MSNIVERVKRLASQVKIHEDYQTIFSTPEGQRVLSHILKHAHGCKSTFVAGDPYQTAFREGQRTLALSILRFTYKDHGEIQKQLINVMTNEAEV